MPFTRQPAQGTVVKFTHSGSDVAIAGLLKITPPTSEPILKNTTGYGDTAERVTAVGVMKHGGFSLEGDFDPQDTGHAALLDKIMAGEKVDIVIAYPTATGMTDEFSLYLKLGPGTDLKGMLTWKLDTVDMIDGSVTRAVT